MAHAEPTPESETEAGGTKGESDTSTGRSNSECDPPEVLARLENISDKSRLIITHLMTEGLPNKVEAARAKAFAYSRISLYTEICGYLRIRVNSQWTKQKLHDTIVMAVGLFLHKTHRTP